MIMIKSSAAGDAHNARPAVTVRWRSHSSLFVLSAPHRPVAFCDAFEGSSACVYFPKLSSQSMILIRAL